MILSLQFEEHMTDIKIWTSEVLIISKTMVL